MGQTTVGLRHCAPLWQTPLVACRRTGPPPWSLFLFAGQITLRLTAQFNFQVCVPMPSYNARDIIGAEKG